MNRTSGVSVGFVLWLVIGVVVAINHGYASHGLHTSAQIINFVLATLLWPAVWPIGYHFQVH